ncbi:MAG: peptidoglycan-binding domain-containing protein [bacterium]|nr:peptidoglycan-binding domain-containing protein [bacterium]
MSKNLFKFLCIIAVLFIIPSVSFGFFERDLYFGLKNSSEVSGLQEFLQKQGVYSGPVNGNFFSLTREGVKKFQIKESIKPALGYFGSMTRAAANRLVVGTGEATKKADLIATLQVQIKALNDQLQQLQKQQQKEKEEELAKTSEIPAVPETPSLAPVPPPPALEISGEKNQTFPTSYTSPLKIGDFTIANRTGNDILFAQIKIKITDQMDSFLNRNKEIQILLRKGSWFSDTLISKTAHTFSSLVVPEGSSHIQFANLSYPILIKNGEEVTTGLWIENFDYVTRGSLKFEFYEAQATTAISPKGGFNFTLSRVNTTALGVVNNLSSILGSLNSLLKQLEK